MVVRLDKHWEELQSWLTRSELNSDTSTYRSNEEKPCLRTSQMQVESEETLAFVWDVQERELYSVWGTVGAARQKAWRHF